MKLPGSSVHTVLLPPCCLPLFLQWKKLHFYFTKLQEGRKFCVSPWDCLHQSRISQAIVSQSTAGRTEIISRRVCDGCSGGTSLADTHRQLLMLTKSFCAGVASYMTYVMGGVVVPARHPLQGSCQCWDLCFQLRTQGQTHGGRVRTCGLALGVCKDSSGASSVGQWGTAGGHTLA